MGEVEIESNGLIEAVSDEMSGQLLPGEGGVRLRTPGGSYQVRWDADGKATALGRLAFFGEFLEVTGLFERWVASCPLGYTSPNAPAAQDVLGTWLLSILDGQRRYAHITGLRGDSVAPGILGMNRILR